VSTSDTIVLGKVAGTYGSPAVARPADNVQIPGNLNVGLGAINPAAKVTVTGTGVYNVAGAARFDLFNTTANSGFLQHVLDNGSWQIANTAGATRMLIDPGGAVQIPGDLNVSGSLALNIVNAATQFNLGGQRILSTAGFQNTFLGLNTGANNAAGCCNAFFGFNAGRLNNANDNSFFGNNAGQANTTGARNSFFGSVAGFSNQTGVDNSLDRKSVVQGNIADNNSFFGSLAGRSNTTGNTNA